MPRLWPELEKVPMMGVARPQGRGTAGALAGGGLGWRDPFKSRSRQEGVRQGCSGRPGMYREGPCGCPCELGGRVEAGLGGKGASRAIGTVGSDLGPLGAAYSHIPHTLVPRTPKLWASREPLPCPVPPSPVTSTPQPTCCSSSRGDWRTQQTCCWASHKAPGLLQRGNVSHTGRGMWNLSSQLAQSAACPAGDFHWTPASLACEGGCVLSQALALFRHHCSLNVGFRRSPHQGRSWVWPGWGGPTGSQGWGLRVMPLLWPQPPPGPPSPACWGQAEVEESLMGTEETEEGASPSPSDGVGDLVLMLGQ